jgi:peptidoglycan hydrolase CwlO-like protein
MKSFGYVSLAFLLALSLLTACESTRSFTGIGSSGEEELLAMVPAEEQDEVRKAEFDLKVAEEKLKLADMKKELASLQKKLADYEQGVAKEYRKETDVGVDLAKWQTIDKAGFGEKQDNIEKIADLRAKKLKLEAARIKIKAKRDTTEEKIKDLTQQMEEQETIIMNLEAGGVPATPEEDVTEQGEKPE